MTGQDRHGGDELDDAAIGLARSTEDRPRPGDGAGEPRWILFAALAAAIIVADQLDRKSVV